MKKKKDKTTHVRIYLETLKKLKIEAANRGITIVELLEEKVNS